eukprot:GSMAST32.ASY1.ANO1.370.1 assembled CDS
MGAKQSLKKTQFKQDISYGVPEMCGELYVGKQLFFTTKLWYHPHYFSLHGATLSCYNRNATKLVARYDLSCSSVVGIAPKTTKKGWLKIVLKNVNTNITWLRLKAVRERDQSTWLDALNRAVNSHNTQHLIPQQMVDIANDGVSVSQPQAKPFEKPRGIANSLIVKEEEDINICNSVMQYSTNCICHVIPQNVLSEQSLLWCPRVSENSSIFSNSFVVEESKKKKSKTEEASRFRDRASERRKGLNIDYKDSEISQSISVENSKFLGGDEEHTHLVKGLDYALLKKVRQDR